MAEFSDRTLVISPHFDDAIFSCGAFLSTCPDAVVATVYSGAPKHWDGLTPWDQDCGFTSSRAAMAEREREDDEALEHVGADAVRLGFLDDQYISSGLGDRPDTDVLAGAISSTISAVAARRVIIPMGLYHSDHRRVHDACLSVFQQLGERVQWLAYEEALYRRMTGVVQQRLGRLFDANIETTPAFPTYCAPIPFASVQLAPIEAKHAAVHAYRSQLKAFGPNGYNDVREPERYWHLSALSTSPQR